MSDTEKTNDLDVNEHVEEVILHAAEPRLTGVPKTMQQLAELNAQRLAMTPPEKPEDPNLTSNEIPQSINSSRMPNNDTKTPSVLRTRSTRGRKRARSQSSSEETGGFKTPERVRLKTGKTSGPSAPPRTLRPRIPKSNEKKQQERELELAYRRAIGE